ncbi:hypothetical protein [Natronomonas moolapensis]|uniref:hypothetical protein n=1 Tax=Natronomonas moolapensis TaxID=416273 RepID=UPI001362BE46|nr:hypothetical protein [Natronomonas moolapensis]
MTDYKENGESHVSDANTQGDELVEAVEEAVDDWVANDSIEAYKKTDIWLWRKKS